MTSTWNDTKEVAGDNGIAPATSVGPNDPVWFASLWGGLAVTEDGFPTDSSSSDEECVSPSSADQQKQSQDAKKSRKLILIVAIALLLVVFGAIAAGLTVAFRADDPKVKPNDADNPTDSASNTDAGRLENWRFVKGDDDNDDDALRLFQDPASWENVIVPHSWNVHDGQDGGGNYYRGPGWYQHSLTIANYDPKKRYFLRFQGVGTVATVYVNSVEVGHHEGGYTAFVIEITDHIDDNGSYDIRVLADNSYRDDIMPLSGDFTVAGGIHRPVDLVIKDAPICFSQLDDASQGVRIFQENVSEELASLRVNVVLDSTVMQEDEAASVVVALKDSTETIVASDRVEVLVPSGNTLQAETILSIANPHLWHGIEDPYHYTLNVSLMHQSQIVDRYTKEVGFRFVHVDPEKGFYLNGKPFPLRGVNMHYDHQDMGAALTDDQVREDFALVRELGANSVQLAHYPHAALSHELMSSDYLFGPKFLSSTR